MPRECNHRGVVEIIIPERVQAVPIFFRRAHQRRILGFVLGDNQSAFAFSGVSGGATKSQNNVLGRTIEDLLGGV
jgi:hypothetical protein